MEMDMLMDICNHMERDMRIDENIQIGSMTDEINTYNQMKPKYNTTFNFVESSKEWLANKMNIGQGHYKYICGTITKSGNKCKNAPITDDDKCHLHRKRNA